MSKNQISENPTNITEVNLKQAAQKQPVLKTSNSGKKVKSPKKKRILIYSLASVVLAGLVTFLLCGLLIKSYSLDPSVQIADVALNEEVDDSNIYVIRKNLFGEEKILVTEDMIVESDDTSTPGKKQMKIKVGNQIFTVEFFVKFRVEFVVDSVVIKTQLVLNASEIEVPTDFNIPEGMLFASWNIEIPTELTTNLRIEAVFINLDSNVPNLGYYSATYGDKLSSITLPSNEYGSWKFPDSSLTVGNAGTNTFKVVFESQYEYLNGREGTVQIGVAKKQVNFTIIKDSFIYDGLSHKPEYTWDADCEVSLTFYGSQNPTEIGTYYYDLNVEDPNYVGSYSGQLNITQPEIVITVNDITITYGESIPALTWTVTSKTETGEVVEIDGSFLNIRQVAPTVVYAGTYESYLTVDYNSSQFKNVTIINGDLIIEKADYNLDDEHINFISSSLSGCYTDKLDTVLFPTIPTGTWQWEDDSIVIDTANKFSAVANFIPHNNNYNEVRGVELEFTVNAKEVQIVFGNTNFIYSESEIHSVSYQIFNGDVELIEGVDVTVNLSGDVNKVSASNFNSETGEYIPYTLIVTIDSTDGRYTGSDLTNWVIEKKTPTADFSTVYEANWRQSLSDIELPEHYSWVSPETVLEEINTNNELKFKAIYDLNDYDSNSVNYEVVEGYFTVNVKKLVAKVNGLPEQNTFNVVYSGKEFVVENITIGHGEESVLSYEFYTVTQDTSMGERLDSIVDVGSYVLILTFSETEHYTAVTVEAYVNITEAKVSAPDTLTAVYEDTLEDLLPQLPETTLGTWSFAEAMDTVLGDAGHSYKYNLVFTSNNDNFASYTKEITVTVVKKELQFTVTQNEFLFDGLEHEVIYEIKDASGKVYTGLTVESNIDPMVNAFDEVKSVRLVIVSNNYSGTVETTFKINKIVVTAPTADTTRYVYNGSDQTYQLATNEYYTISNNVAKEPGEYVVIVGLNDRNNYVWTDGTNEQLRYTFVINKAVYDMSNVTWGYDSQNPFVYTGVKHTVELVGLPEGVSANYQDNSKVDAGTYTATATLVYDKVHYEAPSAIDSLEWEITKATLDINWTYQDSYIFGTTLMEPTATVTLFDDSILDLIVTTDREFYAAGEYTFTASLPVEYQVNYLLNSAQTSITVNVEKESIDMNGVRWDYTEALIYNGELQTVQLINLPEYVTPIYSNNSFTEVGTYTATVTFECDDNHSLDLESLTLEWKIEKATLDVVWEVEPHYVYGAINTLPKAYVYTFESEEKLYLEVSTDREFYAAGVYTFTASLPVENRANYILNSDTNTKEVTIGKALFDMSKVSWNYTIPFEFDFNEHKVEVTGLPEGLTPVYTNNVKVNAGTYKASVTFTYDEANYEAPTEVAALEWGILPHEVLVDWVIGNYTYTGSALSYPLASITYGDETLELVVTPNKEFKNAGSYIFTATTTNGNYKLSNEVATVTVNQAAYDLSEVVWNYNNTPYVYTSLAHKVYLENLPSTITLEYSNAEKVAAGTYTATVIEINYDTVNYVYPEELLTKTLEWSIDKALVDVNWIVDEYTYGEVSSTPKATFDKVEGGAEYLTVTSDRKFEAAGDYTFTASLPSSYEANYILNEATTTRVVNIMKASFNMENVKWDYEEAFTYDLTTHEVEVTGLPDGLTPVHVNNSAKDAGKYVATVTFTYDEDNFNAPAAVMPLEWEILAASVEVKWVVPTYIYNKEVQNYPTASITYQVGSNKETIVLDVKTDKEFMVVDSYNFVASTTNTNYILTNNNQTVEIKPAIVTVPVVLAKQYTGELQKSGLVDNELYKVVSDDGGIELGTYHVTVELQDSDNYIWSEKGLGGEYTATMVVSYEISATVNSWNSVPSVESSFVYNPTSNVVVNKGEAEFGNLDAIVYYKTYGSDEEYTTVKPVNVGKYVAKVVIAKTEEYSELVYNDLVFEIVPCQITEPAEINTPFFYDESEQTYNLAVLEGIYEVKNNVAKDHGTYIVTVSLIDKDNYVWETSLDSDDLTYTFVIQKGTYNPTIPTPTAPYGTSLKDVTLNATDGVWTWNNINDKVGNKGSQTHLAKFVPTDTNYNECIDVEIIIDVTQAQTVITDLSISSWVYNETAVDPQANTNFGDVYFKYSNEENGTYVSTVPTDAGAYFVKAFVDETDNYSSATSEAVAFEIYKATPTVVWPTAEKLTMEWGNSLSSLDINSSFEFVDVNINELYNTPDKYPVKIKYISSDSNYSDLENTVTVIVTKKVTTIEYTGSESFDYDVNNTNGFELTYKTNSTAEVTWYAQYTSFLDNAQAVGKGQIIDAGTYVVTAICEENELYYEGTLTTTIVVNKHEEVIADEVEAEYNDSLSQLVVPTSNYGTWTYEAMSSTFSLRSTSDLVFDELVDVIIYAVFTPHSQYINNFATIRKEITVKVEKRTLNIEIDNSFEDKVGFIYDSTEKLATYKVYDKDGTLLTDEQLALLGVTITGNEGLINVGSKVVTLNVNGTYYRGLKSFTLEVEKANYDLSEVMLNDGALTYTGDSQSVHLIKLPNSINVTEYSGNTATTIGDYTLSVVSFTYDSHNYYEPTFDEYNWKIVEKAVSVSWENVSYTYNPEGQTLPKAYITLVTGETIKLHVEPNDTFLNANDYLMTASITDEMLEENNLLANYTLSNNTKPYTIAKATPTTLFGTALDGEYVYGTKLSKVPLPTGYTWNNLNESISVIGLGEYTATLAETANYLSATGVIKVEGIRREQELTIANNISFDYTGSNILLSILKADELGTAHVRLNHNEEFTYTAKYYTDSDHSNEVSYMRNAGTYYVILTINQTATYNSATANFTVVVNTIAPNVARPTVSELTFVYGTTLNSELLNATLIRDVEGNWIVTEQVLTTLGANFINLTFDPTDPNYHNIEFTNVEISVSTIETNVILAEHLKNETPVEYTSSPFVLGNCNWFSTNRPEGVKTKFEFTIGGTPVTQITDAGTYTINYKVPAEGAYSSAEGTVTVTISKSDDYTVSNTSSLTATYGETLSQYTSSLPNDNSIPGSYHWKVNGELVDGTSVRVGNATTGTNKNTFTAVFVPKNTNYVSKEVTVSFTVNRATITFENIVSTFDYNGTTQYVTYTLSGVISGDANPEVTGNTGIKDAGTTEVTLSVDTANYVGQSSAINLTINAVAPTLSIPAQTVYEDRLPENYGLTTNATATFNGSTVAGSFEYSDSQITMGTNSTTVTKTVNVTVTFTPNSSNYTTQTGTMVVTINAVAKNDNYYFGTVEQALNSTSAGVVTVIPGTNPIIKGITEVKSGVTLFIPYADGLSVSNLSSSTYGQAIYHIDGTVDANGVPIYNINNPSSTNGVYDAQNYATLYPERLITTLTICANYDEEGNAIATLVNNGTIEISGQLSAGGGGSKSGHTYGYYTKMSLKEKAIIENNGKILSFGYIDEESLNNGSEIISNSSSTIYMPYIVIDFRGGSYCYAVNNTKTATTPYNQYELRNVSVKTTYKYGSKLIGWGNLWAGDQHNYTEAKMFGTDSTYFIQMTESAYSYIVTKFNPETEITDVDVYGGAIMNGVKLKIKLKSIMSVDIDTNEFYQCLSWRYDIELNPHKEQADKNELATFKMLGMYKLLPGAKFKVNQGAYLELGSLTVYKDWVDTCTAGSADCVYGVGRTLDDAEMIINGKVTATNIAGYIKTEVDDAELNVIGHNTNNESPGKIKTREATEGVIGSGTNASTKLKVVLTILNLNLYINGDVQENTTNVGAGLYVSIDGGWFATSGSISYDGNEGECSIPSTDSFDITLDGYVLTEEHFPTTKPTREHYKFTGWYYDVECSEDKKAQVGDRHYTSVTLFAGWEAIEYDINYIDVFYDEEDRNDSDETVNNNQTKFTVETYEEFIEAPTRGELTFGGYYYLSDLEDKKFLLDGSELIKCFNEETNSYNIYLYWCPANSDIYSIIYDNSKNLEDYNYAKSQNDLIVVTQDTNWDTLKLKTFTEANADTEYGFWFEGWYLNGTKVDKITPEMFNGNKECTLVANWQPKNMLRLTTVTHKTDDSEVTDSRDIYYVPGHEFTRAELGFVDGYAYTATIKTTEGTDAATDLTIGTTLSSTGFADDVTINIDLHYIFTVTFSISNTGNFNSYKLSVDQYVDSNGKIIFSNKSISSNGSITVIYGSTVTVEAEVKGYSVIITTKYYNASLKEQINGGSQNEVAKNGGDGVASLLPSNKLLYSNTIEGNVNYSLSASKY